MAISAIAMSAAVGSSGQTDRSQQPDKAGNFAAQVSAGREVYISEGCMHCHSQYVRPGTHDVVWWGPVAEPGHPLEQVPPLIGNRRQGPDLMNVGNRRSAAWNRIHLMNPRALVPGSKMPSYAYLFRVKERRGEALIAYLSTLGTETIAQRLAVRSEWKLSDDKGLLDLARTAQLFETNCAACHGKSGAGDGKQAINLGERPPRDLTHAQWQFIPRCENQADRLQEIARVIKFGVPTTSMPGHETMSDAELCSLARYVESLQRSVHPL
jgi:cytochrome c oxidase cbb3-type subunit 2